MNARKRYEMRLPTPGEYQEAVQFPEAAFLDPDLRESEAEMSALGLPRAVSGAFAVVFPMHSRHARWAVRCFLRMVRDHHERYRAVSSHFEQVALPYTVGFEYLRKGVVVGGKTLPLLKMEWIDGEPLNRFVERHLGDVDVLAMLIKRWRGMMEDLRVAGVAHGDLQHGNVLVTRHDGDFRLRLVDYDTAFVPALHKRSSPEVGHRNYQHPDRDESLFGPYLDHFSGLVIDTALQACRLRPELWERFNTDENLLFRSEDLYDPGTSILFEALRATDELREQVVVLERACYLDPATVPPLSEITQGMLVSSPPIAAPGDGRSADSAGTTMAAVSPKTHARRSFRPGGTRARRSRRDRTRDDVERRFLPATAGTLALVAMVSAGAAFAISPTVVAILVASWMAGWLGTAWWLYRRLHSVRRRTRLMREDAFFAVLMSRLQTDLELLRARRDVVRQSEEERREDRLREIRDEALYEHLKHHFVGDAVQFDGIPHKAVVRLKASGIRTAYQATPERVARVRQMSDETKMRVNLWRATLAAQHAESLPVALSPAEERRLKRLMERQLAGIDAESARIRERIDAHRTERAQITRRIAEVGAPRFLPYLSFLLRLTSYLKRSSMSTPSTSSGRSSR